MTHVYTCIPAVSDYICTYVYICLNILSLNAACYEKTHAMKETALSRQTLSLFHLIVYPMRGQQFCLDIIDLIAELSIEDRNYCPHIYAL